MPENCWWTLDVVCRISNWLFPMRSLKLCWFWASVSVLCSPDSVSNITEPLKVSFLASRKYYGGILYGGAFYRAIDDINKDDKLLPGSTTDADLCKMLIEYTCASSDKLENFFKIGASFTGFQVIWRFIIVGTLNHVSVTWLKKIRNQIRFLKKRQSFKTVEISRHCGICENCRWKKNRLHWIKLLRRKACKS